MADTVMLGDVSLRVKRESTNRWSIVKKSPFGGYDNFIGSTTFDSEKVAISTMSMLIKMYSLGQRDKASEIRRALGVLS